MSGYRERPGQYVHVEDPWYGPSDVAYATLQSGAGSTPGLRGSDRRGDRSARAGPQGTSASFELRLLKVPALYVVAAWLVERRLVVPLAPAPSYLDTGHPYEEEEFLAALRGPAEAIVAMDDGASGG